MSLGKGYEVKLDLFEGPLDLLLYLVQKDEVDIAMISVARVAQQYLEYLDLMRELNINVAADYLHMAATLVRVKAHELLPSSDAPVSEEEEGIFTREQLVRQLLEYKKFKEAARSLRQYEASQAGSFPRGIPDEIETDGSSVEESIGGIGVFDLLTAFRRVLEQAEKPDHSHVVQSDTVRLDDRIDYVLTMVTEREEVLFDELFADDRRRIALVVTFMALLELIKMQEIVFRQESNFDRIYVARRDPATREVFEDELDEADEDEEGAQEGDNG
ncbi:MAG: hypothetical protein GF331_01930 [Chitinivibrionales bacterium]|nr:hypothetical protein [Chitinivibrionales bacterium]